ncbi:MAG: hypothetical protein ACR2RF_00305 [Geminicoccaceae bacterium]
MGDPTWLYREGPDGVEAKIFDSQLVPLMESKGWVDSPAKVGEKPEPPKKPTRRRRKRAT